MEDIPESIRMLYEATDRHFLHDLNIFWQRSSIFTVLQAGLLAAYSAIANAEADDAIKGQLLIFTITGLALAVLGLLIAITTALRVARWRGAVLRVSSEFDDNIRLHKSVESHTRWFPSPTWLGVGIPSIFVAAWAASLILVA